MSHDSECLVGNPTHMPRRDSLRAAKVRKKYEIRKKMRKNVAKNYILQAKCHFYPESYIGKQTKLNLALCQGHNTRMQ